MFFFPPFFLGGDFGIVCSRLVKYDETLMLIRWELFFSQHTDGFLVKVYNIMCICNCIYIYIYYVR